MNIREFVKDKNIFSFHLDQNLEIVALSYNLCDSQVDLIGKKIDYVLNGIFCNDTFNNPRYVSGLKKKVKDCFENKKSLVDSVVVSDEKTSSNYYYSLTVGIELIVSESKCVVLKFNHFKEMDTKLYFYRALFKDFESGFSVYDKYTEIGHFVVDYKIEGPNIFVDDNVVKLLNLKKEDVISIPGTIEYSSISKRHINRDENFFKGIAMLEVGEIHTFVDEWSIGNKWVTLEAKVIKSDADGNCSLIGGVIYDTSNQHKYNDIEYLYTIYELAITSGGIGIFHYNLDKHGPDFYDCNVIYARLLGVEKSENGLYLLEDFKKVLLPLEEDINNNQNVLKSLENLMGGSIVGTNDEIIKIRNLQTDEIKYLLSSSKIDKRFEDGTPRRFGGIIIDITDRIIKEKKQIKFAYNDELTRLSNNRKLMKDIRKKVNGIGLFFDLDNFKRVNDEYGHLFGDKVLRLFGDALRSVSDEYENVVPYRLYGDEFFVFAEGHSESIAKEYQHKLKEYIKTNKNTLEENVTIEASMGYSILSKDMDIDEFIKIADYAMYKVKIKKKDNQYTRD